MNAAQQLLHITFLMKSMSAVKNAKMLWTQLQQASFCKIIWIFLKKILINIIHNNLCLIFIFIYLIISLTFKLGGLILQIKVASNAGFCFGVSRAISSVYKLLDSGKKVCTLGSIIHNPQIIANLLKKGVKIVERPEDVEKDAILVIRSHGVGRDIIQKINDLNLNYLDET